MLTLHLDFTPHLWPIVVLVVSLVVLAVLPKG